MILKFLEHFGPTAKSALVTYNRLQTYNTFVKCRFDVELKLCTTLVRPVKTLNQNFAQIYILVWFNLAYSVVIFFMRLRCLLV